jgi:transposase
VRVTTLLRKLLRFPRRVIIKAARFKEEDDEAVLVVQIEVTGRRRCQVCGRRCPGRDTPRRRRWRHLDVLGFRCYLEGAIRRAHCPDHGVKPEDLPFADPGSRFTRPFEELVTWTAQRCDKTTTAIQHRVSWPSVGRICARVVKRRREPIDFTQLRVIGVDELSYRKGHRYLTLITDLQRGRIIWSKEGRSAETLMDFFREVGPRVCEQIQYAVIDMSEAYRQAIERYLPYAEIVYDRFHVQRLISAAVDETRREEWRRLRGTPDADTIKHTRWALLKKPWHLTEAQSEALSKVQQDNQRLYRAYLLKESFADIYDRFPEPWQARQRFTGWLSWASRSRLPAFLKACRTIRKHLEDILGYFRTRFTNGLVEGLNTKARLATRQAFGFHSADAVRAMIELRCTGLIVPLPHMG